MEKTTMSVQELSAQMGISLPKAYELVKTPGFPTLRIGTRILIPVDAYKEWLNKNASNK
jgi:excisionase family DNA binding protein